MPVLDVEGPVVELLLGHRVARLALRLPQVLAVNASFFDLDGQAMGLVAGAGRSQVRWGALVVQAGRARVTTIHALTPKERRQVLVQGTPILVVGGKPESLKPQVARRTAVCIDGERLALVVTGAADFNQFARFLATPLDAGGAGCKDALNLDCVRVGVGTDAVQAHLCKKIIRTANATFDYNLTFSGGWSGRVGVDYKWSDKASVVLEGVKQLQERETDESDLEGRLRFKVKFIIP